LSGVVLVGEGVELVDQPLGMNPAQTICIAHRSAGIGNDSVQ
jgi:hypothetical protein